MSLISSRLPIAQGLVAFLANVIDPATNNPLFPLTKLGAIYDPGANTRFSQVTHFQGKGGPAGSGGNLIGWRIDESVTFLVTSGFGPYQTNDSTAQSDMLYIQDILLPALRAHFQIPSASNPTQAIQSVYSLLEELVDTSKPRPYPNGNVYLLWFLPIVVRQQYNIQLVQP